MYIENELIKEEIEKSKLSYCWFSAPQYKKYDKIIFDINEATDPLAVYRLVTYHYIPDGENNKSQNPIGKTKQRTNFKPFIHIVKPIQFLGDDNMYLIVAKSHYDKDDKFNPNTGRTTEKLGSIYMEMAKSISRMPRFNGYSYKDEMILDAVEVLLKRGLSYNESKNTSAHSYLTTIIIRAFQDRIDKEKRQRELIEKVQYYVEH